MNLTPYNHTPPRRPWWTPWAVAALLIACGFLGAYAAGYALPWEREHGGEWRIDSEGRRP